jgi:hypothetical protein
MVISGMNKTTLNLSTEQFKGWLEALRSGNYKQGKVELRTLNNEFCCLGVLVDVIDPTAWSLSPNYVWGEYYRGSPPEDIISFEDFNIFYIMNDSDEKTFPEIADFIETNYKPNDQE